MERTAARGSGFDGAEYMHAEVPRRRGAARQSGHHPGRKLRLVFFAVASLWGFAVGALCSALALAAGGTPLRIEPVLGVLLVLGSGIAMAGGAVAASAYREMRRRRSS